MAKPTAKSKQDAKKTVAKKAVAKKPAPKKTAAKKTAPKKTAPKKTAPKKTTAKKTTAKKTTAKKTAPKKTAPKKTTAKKTAPVSGPALTARYGLLLDSRAAFDRLSPTDRAQLAIAGRLICAEADLEAAFAWLEREEMSLFKLQLGRGEAIEWDVWINTAMDDGAVFAPGSPDECGIGISQMDVYDMEEHRDALCAEIDAALRGFRLPEGMEIEDVFWK
jgi:hypothetical protein